jgi:concanavalin A-like lectin/glucanase superfamily protein
MHIPPFLLTMSLREQLLRVIPVFLLVIGFVLTLPVEANAAGKRIAIWHMGDLGADRHTMRDTSPSVPSNDGTTTDIKIVNGWDGYAYKFNGTTSRVVVPDHASLDPGKQAIQITAHVKFRARPLSGVYALVTKGGGQTPYYKMLISSKGKAVCSFRGGLRSASVHGASSLADQEWHTIVCGKRGRSISVSVDGATTSASVRVGAIANARRLFVGAGAGGGSKYRGVMDEVNIRIG